MTIVWLSVLAILHLATAATDNANATKDLLLFQKLFEERRKDHKSAVQSLLTMNDYQKQHKMITLTLERVFQVLGASQERLRVAGYVPGGPFPSDEDVRDALSQTLETTCLLGEVLLHLPDITHKVLRDMHKHRTLLAWGVFFTTQSTFLSANTKKLAHLMTQELRLAEKDPNYENPYVRSDKKVEQERQTKPKKKKKSFRKGPSLSKHYGEL